MGRNFQSMGKREGVWGREEREATGHRSRWGLGEGEEEEVNRTRRRRLTGRGERD